MPFSLRSILLVIAFLSFVLAAFGVSSRIGLVPAGLALVRLVYLFRL